MSKTYERSTSASRRAKKQVKVVHVSKFWDEKGNSFARTLARPGTNPARATEAALRARQKAEEELFKRREPGLPYVVYTEDPNNE